jgi:hypothetical protein
VSDESGRTRSYRSGEWFGIFGERALVLLPPSEKARVAALWELVDDGAGFDEVLDALIATGLRALPAFVLVSEAGDQTRAVVRGPARVVLTAGEETVELDGTGASTWVERSLAGVTRMHAVLGEEVEAGGHTVVAGLVRVGRVDEPPYAPPEPVTEAPTGEWATDEQYAAVPAEPSAPTGPEPSVPPMPPVPPVPSMPPVPSAPPVPPAAEAPEGEPVPDTESVPVPEPWAPPPVAAPDNDHDGMTRTGGWDAEELARQQPGIPGQPPAPGVTRPVARLLFSSGEDVEVDRPVLVGRAPEARRFTSTEQPRLVTVPSPHQEISSTHLEVRPGAGADHGSAVVTDLGSTNGTVIVQPGLPPEDLQPGIAVQLIPGAVIDLGDGVTIQVANP